MDRRDALVGFGLGITWPLLINVLLVALVAAAVPPLTQMFLSGAGNVSHDAYLGVARLATGIALVAIVGTAYGISLGALTGSSPLTGWITFVIAALSSSFVWHVATSGATADYVAEWSYPEAWMAILLVALVAMIASKVRRRGNARAVAL